MPLSLSVSEDTVKHLPVYADLEHARSGIGPPGHPVSGTDIYVVVPFLPTIERGGGIPHRLSQTMGKQTAGTHCFHKLRIGYPASLVVERRTAKQDGITFDTRGRR